MSETHGIPVPLTDLVLPSSSAVVTMECQRGVIGDLATIPSLRRAVVDADLVERMAAVADAARRSHVTVVHALATFRADRLGSPTNAPLLEFAAAIPGQLIEGSEAAELVPELGPHAGDGVSVRHHGVSPFTGTDLDSLLRSRGVTTVVPIGVSLNVGVLGLVIEAVNLGYRVVLPVDATVAVPPAAASGLLDATFSQLAVLTTTDALVAAWP